mmetsp:Transcript_10524/g.30782  ORF Transcript_10524/g.30782 Transcript_10524/m.30782 type:complete len:365 (-) Transcript_10524:307-1401(-)
METDPTTTMTKHNAEEDEEDNPVFSKWREFNINDVKDDDDADDKEDSVGLFSMFDTKDEQDVYEDVRYDYPSSLLRCSVNVWAGNSCGEITADVDVDSSVTSVTIRHHGDYPNSTGLAIWRGAEIMSRFLCDAQQNLDNDNDECSEDVTIGSIRMAALRHKRVLEVGAGAGLPSIVAHKILGASKVLVTDGDFDALHNLKHNVDSNRIVRMTPQSRSDNDGNKEIGDDTCDNENHSSISCCQLIWGKDVEQFLAKHGKQDVVLMADCVYMVPSLKPLWETIDHLLEDDGVVVYVQTAASAVPWGDFKAALDHRGFETVHSVVGRKALGMYDVDNDDDDDDDIDDSVAKHKEEYERGIYIFRRCT